jgi:hypothetical protein
MWWRRQQFQTGRRHIADGPERSACDRISDGRAEVVFQTEADADADFETEADSAADGNPSALTERLDAHSQHRRTHWSGASLRLSRRLHARIANR